MVTNIPLQLLPIENDGFHLMVEVEINGKKAKKERRYASLYCGRPTKKRQACFPLMSFIT